MGAVPACDIPAWMVRTLSGEGTIEIRRPRALAVAAGATLAGGGWSLRTWLDRGTGHAARWGALAWLVLAVVLVGAGLRFAAAAVRREPLWSIGPDGVTVPGWRPGRRLRVGATHEVAWRWDEGAWRLRPLPRSPERRVSERHLRWVRVDAAIPGRQPSSP